MTNNIRVVSDLEGFDIENYFHDTSNLFVCGDILDSTLSRGTPLTGNYLTSKSNNLKNILHCASNPHVRLLYGNRDLNKIKCKYLAELTNTGTETTNFNNGNINLNVETYNALREKLNLDGVWKVSNMNSWYTFWSDVGKGKIWTNFPSYKENPFYDRFIEIFGVDNGKDNGGTMSAQNLLETIPLEIGVSSDNNDYKAFIVLAIFKSMLLRITNRVRFEDVSIESMESSNYKGWLYQMYLRKDNNLCCFLDYGVDKENDNNFMYVFSHGGMPHKILDKPELFANILEYLDVSPELTKLLTDAVEYYKVIPSGGFYNKVSDKTKLLSRDKIISSITILNEIVKANINVVLGNEEIYSDVIDNSQSESNSVNTLSSDDSTQNSTSIDSVENETKQNPENVLLKEDEVANSSEVSTEKDESHEQKSSDQTSDQGSSKSENSSLDEDICKDKDNKTCPSTCQWTENKCTPKQQGGVNEEAPSNNMLFLLIISSGFNLYNFVNKITDVVLKETILRKLIGDKERQSLENLNSLYPSSDKITPMSTGFKTMRNDTPFLDNDNVQLVQFIGHSPNGFGSTIDKVECNLDNGSNAVSYLINLDSSNSFSGSTLNNLDNKIKSKSYCKFKNNNRVKVVTTLVLNIGEKPNETMVHEKFSDHKLSNFKDNHKYITDHDLPLIPIIEINAILGSKLLDEQIEYSGSNNINVHGFTTINTEERIVFSVNDSKPGSFNKNLYCLNLANYQKFIE
jgi:hypothetical protein